MGKIELKQSLYYLCTQYGEVLDIVAKKNIKMRGQAFVIFKDVNAATAALKALNGFNFFDKTIVIQLHTSVFIPIFVARRLCKAEK